MSQVIDDALESATVIKVQKKTSKEANEKFKKAIDALCDYEKEYHFKPIVAQITAEAEAKDRSSTTTLNKMKEKLRVREEFQVTFAHILIPIPSRLWKRPR